MIPLLLTIIIILIFINIALTIYTKNNSANQQLQKINDSILKLTLTLEHLEKNSKDELSRYRTENNQTAKQARTELQQTLAQFSNQFSKNISNITQQQQNFNNQANKQLNQLSQNINQQLKQIQHTVDEKLQTTLEKRLGESFKQVSQRLEQVHKGLGEMKNIATGVGDLKKVLSNVKTRGVLGEYQLENILEQLLTKEQYAKNVATKKGSQANVEFAIKLPGKEKDHEVWLPIDSKFPIEDYNRLLDAFNSGNKTEIDTAHKTLTKTIENFAKTIKEKYIDPPHTTDFAIMFLPIESLYAEVLRDPQLFQTLQRKHKITVVGPTTLSALLTSLQMGFRTLSVQKRSSQVWDILKAVKHEFNEFSTVLSKLHKQLNTATGTLENLRNTRTNVMQRKLKEVEECTTLESEKILPIEKQKNLQ